MSSAYTEQDLREAEEATGHRIDIGLPRPYDRIVRRVATRISRIRSEARAGMREACAKYFEDKNKQKGHAITWHLILRAVVEDIRNLPDLAADEAIERIKREAVLIELKRLEFHVHTFESGVQPWTKVDSRCEACERIAALSGKETEHEG